MPSGEGDGVTAQGAMTAAVSVVTIVRARTAHLVQLVRGLERGTAHPSELVVVVMGGEDPAPHLPTLPFPVVRRWCHPDGSELPLARARNLGVRAARGDAVVLLDVDCIPGRELVGAYGRAVRSVDALHMGAVRYLEPGAAEDGWDEPHLRARSRPHPGRPAPDGPGPVPTDVYELFWSLSFALRRGTFLDVLGGFDETLDGYGGEDTDLAFTARDRGVPLCWLPEAVAYHQHHETFSPPLQHLRSIAANATRFRAKWGVWPMTGWLAAFAERGLVAWAPSSTTVEVLRDPSTEELEAARRDQVVPP